MGKRRDSLERVLVEAESWVAFAKSKPWQKLKEQITAYRDMAKEAWHVTNIDGLSNDVLVRQLAGQRATVKTCDNIINMVESWLAKRSTATKELKQIEARESKRKSKDAKRA